MLNVITCIVMLKTTSHITKKRAIIFFPREVMSKIIYNSKGTLEECSKKK